MRVGVSWLRRRDSLLVLAGTANVLAVVFLLLPVRSPEPAAVSSPQATATTRGEALQPRALRRTREQRAERVLVAATPPGEVAGPKRSGETEPTPTGCLRGRVIDQYHAPVASAKVMLYRGRTKYETEVDAGGEYAFEDLPRGLYRLYVDRRSLPAGYLPPWRQQVPREYRNRPTGIFGTAIRLAEDDQREVDLLVFAAGAVRGRVVGPAGEPVAKALVSLQSTGGVSAATRTDALGRFALDSLYPGTYVTRVPLGPERATSEGSSPLPMRFEVAPGELRALPDLVLGAVAREEGRADPH